ncbi:TonB-dependent siderophore receptor [Lampropedia puyangensis]|uniref:TonB-dependent siderophore receptor n=1 Tax=Lampropedia puyangensis TaxID=1330072 RepID=A0A4S8F493_9BURK|nr:TonB-dependent siderophore receptor [Lampropedia puyangensis]THU01937.1 TonB-dependent siderophore receptor [Lampropedia puyangensis]
MTTFRSLKSVVAAPESALQLGCALPRRLRPIAAAVAQLALIGGIGAGVAMHAAQAQTPAAATTQAYNIPAAALQEVLAQLGASSGLIIQYDAALLEGLRSQGVQGTFAPAVALQQALRGTGVEAVSQGGGAYALRAQPAQQVSAAHGQAEALTEVVVSSAISESDASSEYTGMYAPVGQSNTASRMDLRLQETPQSVSVITHQQIDELGLQTVDDVLLHTTGVTAATAAPGGGYQFTSRGFDITNMQVDGLQGSYRATGRGPFNASILDSSLYDRVEVVRGATGLVTGAGDPSAVVNMVRKRPGKTFAASASAAIGTWGHRRVTGDVSGALTADGRVRARVIGARRDTDSFVNYRSEDDTLLSGTFEVDVLPTTLLTFGHDYQATNQNGESNTGIPIYDSTGARVNVPRSTTVAPDWTYWDKRYNNSFIYLDHAFDNGWKAKIAYSHNKNTGNALVSGNGSTVPRLVTLINPDGSGWTVRPNMAANGYRYQDNAEINANGPFTLFGRTHQLSVGMSGTRSADTANTLDFASPQDYAVPNLYEWDGSAPEPTVVWTGAKTRTVTQQHGYFGSARFHVVDPLHVVVGGRLSSYKTYRDNYATTGALASTNARLDYKNELIPFVGLTYAFNPQLTAYASYTEIFKPQSYRDKNNNFLDPITGKNVEVGLKSELLDKRLNLNVALFEAKQDNLAVIDDSVPLNSLPDGGQAYLSKGKGNRSRGVEIEATGFLSRDWQVFAAYSNTKTEDGEGNTINTHIPRQMFKLGTSYRFGGALSGLSAASTVHWHGKRDMWTVGAGSGGLSLPGVGVLETPAHGSYTTVGVHLGYRINSYWQATLNINNLFDKQYYDNYVPFRAKYGAPRNAQLAVRYQW